MIVHNYHLDRNNEHLVVVDPNFNALIAKDDAHSKGRAELLVWREAMASPELKRCMSTPGWPIELVTGTKRSNHHRWRMSTPRRNIDNRKTILSSLLDASGALGRPRGNVAVTLSLRHYNDRASEIGGLDWWRKNSPFSARRASIAAMLADELLRVLAIALDVGSKLFIEQISILVGKDPEAPLASLTPTLHSDKYYGPRESAIVSLLEPGWDSIGGALFLPTVKMDRLWHLRPIDLRKLNAEVGSEPLLATGSGDILIYDGMIDRDGSRRRSNGIPHISSDTPGETSRLVVLMYHRRN